MPKRLDASDTIEGAIHFLHGLAEEGWGVEALEHRVEYVKTGRPAKRLPIGARVVIRLIPSRP